MKRLTDINREHYEPAGEGWVRCIIWTKWNECGEGFGRTEKQALKAARANLVKITNSRMGAE